MKRLMALMTLTVLTACDSADRADFRNERADALYQSAMDDYRAGRLDAAVKGFTKVLLNDPGNASARFQLACLQQDSRQDFVEAYCGYREYLRQYPKSDKAPLAFVEARKAVRDGLKARGREDLTEDLWNVFATTAAWRLMNLRDPVAFRKVYDCLHQGGLDYFKKKEFGFDGIAEPLFRRHAKMVYENDDPIVILLNEVWRLRKRQNERVFSKNARKRVEKK